MASASAGDRMWGLRELPHPDPISLLPQTSTWIVLGALVLCGVAWFGWHRYRAWQQESYRRVALTRLSEMSRNLVGLETLPLLLRSTALAAFPRNEVAGLRGEEWIAWLNATSASSAVQFVPDDAQWLDQLAYQSNGNVQVSSESVTRLLAASRDFVRSHRARV